MGYVIFFPYQCVPSFSKESGLLIQVCVLVNVDHANEQTL